MSTYQRQPFVSVIVPVYNGEGIIADCIESLLAQDYAKDRYEVIVVDNDSTDGTAEVIERFPVNYVKEAGVHTSYAARNTGAAEAKGDLFAFCDADEVADAAWLSQLVGAFSDGYGGAAGVLVCDNGALGIVGRFAAREAEFKPSKTDTDIELAPTGNVLYARSVFERLGGFYIDAPSGADYDFSLRVVRELGMKIRYTPRAVQHHRHRATLGKLLKHEARMGFGRAWVSGRHNERVPGLITMIAGLIVRVAMSAAAGLVALVQIPFRKGMIAKLGEIVLGVLMAAANVYGRLRFRFFKKLPRNW